MVFAAMQRQLEFRENLLLLSKWWQIHRKLQIQMVKIANNVIKTTQLQILLRAEIPKFSRSMMPKNRLKVKFVLNNTLFNWYNLEVWGHQRRWNKRKTVLQWASLCSLQRTDLSRFQILFIRSVLKAGSSYWHHEITAKIKRSFACRRSVFSKKTLSLNGWHRTSSFSIPQHLWANARTNLTNPGLQQCPRPPVAFAEYRQKPRSVKV